MARYRAARSEKIRNLVKKIFRHTYSEKGSKMKELSEFLSGQKITPVLVDVGSSGYRHKIWDPISINSRIIGFDPDNRHFDPEFEKMFHDALLVSKAVTNNDTDTEVEFILTRYPSCSSILPGDIESLEPFMFRDYFVEERRATAEATSLNRVIAEYNLGQLDWIKIDAQGFDLEIIKSMSPDNMARVVAFDIEPGFIDAYKNEALFPEMHTYMKEQGFWLSDLQYQAYPRTTPEEWDKLVALAEANGQNAGFLIRKMKGAPTAAEALYLRDLNFMQKSSLASARMYKVLFVFCLLDNHLDYTFDVVKAFSKRFGHVPEHKAAADAMSAILEERFKQLF